MRADPIPQLPDGVYLGLPFAIYLGQKGRLGSSDKTTLWRWQEGWWWKTLSPFARPSSQTDEQLFGECAHAALLEGLHAYETRYVVEPNKADYPEALFTIPQIKAALQEANVHLRGSSGWGKDDWAEAAEMYLPDRVVWDNVMAEFNRLQTHVGPGGEMVRRRGVPAEVDFAIRAMRDLAIEDRPDNQEMRELLSVGSEFPILAEVSVLWTDADGLRHRARFDKMLPILDADLKTVGGWNGRPLEGEIDSIIKRQGMDIQNADYRLARKAGFALVLEDEANLHGGTEEEREHFLAMAAYDVQTPRSSWAWIFYQKPDASGRGPILFPLREPWGGPYHRAGFRKRWAALETYKAGMARFGPDQPWGRVEPLHWPAEYAPREASEAGHVITLGAYEWGPQDEVPGEQEHFLATGDL